MSNEITLTLAALEGRLPARLDGRARRTKVLAHTIRKRFMEVQDDDGKLILVYITDTGAVRKDVKKVQDELAEAGEFAGINDDEEADLDEVMNGRKRRRENDEDAENEATEEEDTDGPEETPTDEDLEAVEQDEPEGEDDDYTPSDGEEEESDDDIEEEAHEEEEEADDATASEPSEESDYDDDADYKSKSKSK